MLECSLLLGTSDCRIGDGQWVHQARCCAGWAVGGHSESDAGLLGEDTGELAQRTCTHQRSHRDCGLASAACQQCHQLHVPSRVPALPAPAGCHSTASSAPGCSCQHGGLVRMWVQSGPGAGLFSAECPKLVAKSAVFGRPDDLAACVSADQQCRRWPTSHTFTITCVAPGAVTQGSTTQGSTAGTQPSRTSLKLCIVRCSSRISPFLARSAS